MKYVVVERSTDNIRGAVNAVDIEGVIINFADKMSVTREFLELNYKIMTETEWDTEFKNNLYGRQLGKRKYEWWKDDESYLDIDHDN